MNLLTNSCMALCCVFWCCVFESCYISRAYRSRKFLLKDLPKIEAQTIAKSDKPFYFPVNVNSPIYKDKFNLLDEKLTGTDTYSFLIIKDDTIIYEKYFDGLQSSDIFPSFSVAKSFVGTLVQIAHQEGKIKSLNEPITNYLPYLLKRDKRFSQITLQHLLDMRSGIKSDENYSSPFSDVIKLGFRRNIQRQLTRLQIKKEPGQLSYKSVNTQLLAMIVQQATGKKLYNYLQEKIWQPLGMEANASWNIDSRKHDNVKAFCCLNATTNDFAKLGRLYLNKGMWNGIRILDSSWIHATVSADSMYKYDGYRNQWWGVSSYKEFNDSLSAIKYQQEADIHVPIQNYYDTANRKYHYYLRQQRAYMAEGILGQYIYVNPATNVIIVRNGHYFGSKSREWPKLIFSVDANFTQ